MKINLLSQFIFIFLTWTFEAIKKEDLVKDPPGMKDVMVYSGYLDTYQNDRKLHYVLV